MKKFSRTWLILGWLIFELGFSVSRASAACPAGTTNLAQGKVAFEPSGTTNYSWDWVCSPSRAVNGSTGSAGDSESTTTSCADWSWWGGTTFRAAGPYSPTYWQVDLGADNLRIGSINLFPGHNQSGWGTVYLSYNRYDYCPSPPVWNCWPYGIVSSFSIGSMNNYGPYTYSIPNVNARYVVIEWTPSPNPMWWREVEVCSYCAPVNGGWSGWTDSSGWVNVGTCGQYNACQQRQDKTQSRTCNNPAPSCGGAACSGSATQTITQYVSCGATNGGWSAWDPVCPACSDTPITQTRTCTNPAPSCGGATCTGTSSQTCSIPACSYTVTGIAGVGGTISPPSQSATYGGTTTLTVTPDTGYTASASGCGGSLVGTTYTTGAITANCTVTATFSLNTYTVTGTAGAGGSISPPSRPGIPYGSTTTFTVTPAAGYIASASSTCGGSLVGNTFTTGAVTANCTVTATFSLIVCYSRHVENSASRDWSAYLTKVYNYCYSLTQHKCNLGAFDILAVGDTLDIDDSGSHLKRIYISNSPLSLTFSGNNHLQAGGILASGDITLTQSFGSTPSVRVVTDPAIYLIGVEDGLQNVGVSHTQWQEVTN